MMIVITPTRALLLRMGLERQEEIYAGRFDSHMTSTTKIGPIFEYIRNELIQDRLNLSSHPPPVI